jgi:CheY-like chemotaxis protein
LQSETPGYALLTVEDNGAGIDSATLPSLFEPFVQAKQTLDRTKGGLGLGLALVRGIVELHGGSVTAQSEGVGRGSRFAISLATVEPPKSPTTVTAGHHDSKDHDTYRILVVEDNADAAIALQKLLSFRGHQVVVAPDGESALKSVQAFRPQIILSDLGLPGAIDGFALAEEIQKLSSSNPAFLIAISGYGQVEDQARTKLAGFDMHVVKPVDAKALEKALLAAKQRIDGREISEKS